MARGSDIASSHRRGYALALVIVAVAIGVTLSCAFLSAQGLSAQISHNIEGRARARLIAESGLAMAVAYVQTSDTWRTDHVEGAWASDQPFAGGTFTISAQDGEDRNGVIDGDGNLADNPMDMVTLTCVGTYQGATHTSRAVVAPTKRVLMIVPDPDALTGEDSARYNLLRNWGWRVRLLAARARGSEFDSAAQGVQVVYFPAHARLENQVRDRLTASNLPIVTEKAELVGLLRIAGGNSRVYTDTAIDVLQLTQTFTDDLGNPVTEVVKHYVTSPFAVGPLTICQTPDQLLRVDAPATGTQALAAMTTRSDRVALGVLEYGAIGTDNRPARARRVALPWGDDNFAFSINSLNANGQLILRRSLDWAGSSWQGLMPGLAVWDKIETKDMARIDGFDSTKGAYGGGNVSANATISTNSLGADKIKIDGGVLSGSIYVSPDADASKVVEITSRGALTGSVRTLDLNVPIPTPQEPDLGGGVGNLTYANGNNFIFMDLHINRLTITGDARVRILGDVALLCDAEVRIDQNAELIVGNNSSLTIFTKKAVVIAGNAQVNVRSADPSRLEWQILRDKIEVQDASQLYAVVKTYDGELRVKGVGQFCGTFVGKKLSVEGSGACHVDTALSGTVISMGGGVDLGRIGSSPVRWIDKP